MASLKDLVQDRIDGSWESWAQRHPNLAAAIDRVQLIDRTVDQLRQDPDYVEAMQQSQLDENQLLAAARVIALIERMIGRTIR